MEKSYEELRETMLKMFSTYLDEVLAHGEDSEQAMAAGRVYREAKMDYVRARTTR